MPLSKPSAAFLEKTDANGDVIRYYSSTSLNNALKVRKEALTKQVFLLDKNPDIVNIIKDDGTMDEELVDYFNGIKSGMLTSDSNTFKQSYNGILNHTAKQFDYNEKMYIKYEKLLQKQTGSLTVGELKKDNDNDDLDTILWGAVGEDMGDNDVLPKDYLRQMTKLYSDRGKEYNEIYETYGKAKYRQQTAWNPEGLSPEKIEGTEEFQEIQDNKAYKKGAVTDAEEEFDDRAYEEGAVSEADPSLIGGQNLQKTTYTPDDTEEGDEGGIDFGKITAGVVLTGAAASTEPVQKVGKAIVKATKDGAKYLSTAYNISAKDIPVLTKEINNKKGSIRVALDKIKNLEEKIKTIDSKNRVKNKGFSFIDKSIDTAKDDPYRTKRLNITNKINAIKKDMVEKTAKRFKIKPEDVARMLSNKEMSKWNPVKVKDYFMNKFPKATKEFYKTSKIVKGAKGLAQYRAGAELADLSGIDLGEGFIAETAEDVTATAAATKALNEAGKRFIPKLKSIATSPKGRQAIIKLLGERVGKNLIKQAAGSAVPGIGNIAMTLTGAVLGIKDFIQFVFSYNEE